MGVYRVTRTLSVGARQEEQVQPGAIRDFSKYNEAQIKRLLAVGAIAPIMAPPLAKLPGWSRRAARLNGIGITSVQEFLDAPAEVLGPDLSVKPATVERWKQELIEKWLRAPAVKRGG